MDANGANPVALTNGIQRVGNPACLVAPALAARLERARFALNSAPASPSGAATVPYGTGSVVKVRFPPQFQRSWLASRAQSRTVYSVSGWRA